MVEARCRPACCAESEDGARRRCLVRWARRLHHRGEVLAGDEREVVGAERRIFDEHRRRRQVAGQQIGSRLRSRRVLDHRLVAGRRVARGADGEPDRPSTPCARPRLTDGAAAVEHLHGHLALGELCRVDAAEHVERRLRGRLIEQQHRGPGRSSCDSSRAGSTTRCRTADSSLNRCTKLKRSPRSIVWSIVTLSLATLSRRVKVPRSVMPIEKRLRERLAHEELLAGDATEVGCAVALPATTTVLELEVARAGEGQRLIAVEVHAPGLPGCRGRCAYRASACRSTSARRRSH